MGLARDGQEDGQGGVKISERMGRDKGWGRQWDSLFITLWGVKDKDKRLDEIS